MENRYEDDAVRRLRRERRRREMRRRKRRRAMIKKMILSGMLALTAADRHSASGKLGIRKQ